MTSPTRACWTQRHSHLAPRHQAWQLRGKPHSSPGLGCVAIGSAHWEFPTSSEAGVKPPYLTLSPRCCSLVPLSSNTFQVKVGVELGWCGLDVCLSTGLWLRRREGTHCESPGLRAGVQGLTAGLSAGCPCSHDVTPVCSLRSPELWKRRQCYSPPRG